MAPVYYKSYWILCYVNDTFKRSYFCMPRSCFYSHHMLIMLLFLPLQQCENSEGGPPCNSMPLVQLGLTICMVKCSYFLVRHRVCKVMLLFCVGSSCQSLKVCRGEVHSQRPRYYVPCSLLKGPAPCCYWLSIA